MRPAGSRKKLFAISGAAVLVLFLAGRAGKLTLFESFGHRVIAPVAKPLNSAAVGVRDFIKTITTIGSLSRQNNQFTASIAELTSRIADYNQLKQENADLRRELGAPYAHNFNLLPAAIIAGDANSFSQTILIDAGSADGVKVGQVVVCQGSLIGAIQEVFDHSARVELLGNADSVVPGRSQRTGADGLVRGKLGAGLLTFDQIDQAADVQAGDMVTATVAGGEAPNGLLIGLVEKVTAQANLPFKTAAVRPVLDVSTLANVFVVLGRK